MTDDIEARLKALPPEELHQLRKDMETLARRKKFNAAAYWQPYPKQIEFTTLTADKKEAALFAGNRVGKSDIGAFITYAHATGRYPAWWKGRRFDVPGGLRLWVAGETAEATRNVPQSKLFGQYGNAEAFGTGMLPKDCILGKPTASRAATDGYDTAQIRHANGSITSLTFHHYAQEREVWQGDQVDFIWLDEEPPISHFTEAQARTMASKPNGSIICTFTPLRGSAGVVNLFREHASDLRGWMRMAMLDAGHFTQTDVDEGMARWLPHEWDARIHGLPARGEGAVFTAARNMVEWDVPRGNGAPTIVGKWGGVPDEWMKIGGLDFGMGHPFAYVLCAWDRETGAFYVLDGVKISNELIIQHAKRIRETGGMTPVAWPHDGHVRDRQSGEEMSLIYKREGVPMLNEHATHPEGGHSFYAGIEQMNQLMNAGKWRVSRHLTDWFSEFEAYHYKDAEIVKITDDILSASRYAYMMRRRGKAGPIQGAGPLVAAGPKRRPITNFDLFTGQPFPEWDERRYR